MQILGYIFIGITLINCVYYLFYARFLFSTTKNNSNTTTVPVAVIVYAKNDAEHLKELVPLLLEQQHPEFELILINNNSHDETLSVIKAFEQQDSRIKIADVEYNEAFWGNKKYALTLGIKKATNPYLLFIDANCKPISKNWIQEMSSKFSEKKQLVLGYGGYTKIKKSLPNKVIRYQTAMDAMQFMGFTKNGFPYTGTGRNMGYTTSLFYEQNGFAHHMRIRSGADTLFINEAAKGKNTAISCTEDSFTYYIKKISFGNWFIELRKQAIIAKNYSFGSTFFIKIFRFSQFSFWSLTIICLLILPDKIVLGSIIAFRMLIQLIITGKALIKFKEKDLLLLLPFLEVFLIGVQFSIFIGNWISKPKL